MRQTQHCVTLQPWGLKYESLGFHVRNFLGCLIQSTPMFSSLLQSCDHTCVTKPVVSGLQFAYLSYDASVMRLAIIQHTPVLNSSLVNSMLKLLLTTLTTGSGLCPEVVHFLSSDQSKSQITFPKDHSTAQCYVFPALNLFGLDLWTQMTGLRLNDIIRNYLF